MKKTALEHAGKNGMANGGADIATIHMMPLKKKKNLFFKIVAGAAWRRSHDLSPTPSNDNRSMEAHQGAGRYEMSEHTKGRLVPKFAGEFTSYQQWVNKGSSWLASPEHRRAMCIDAIGRRVAIGADFMRAREEGTFPVYFFWECELPIVPESDQLSAANARIAKLEALVSERDAMLGKRPCQNSRCNELNAARALLREVSKDGSLDMGNTNSSALGNSVRVYLDACDKPGEQNAS